MNKTTLIVLAFAAACLFQSPADAQRVDSKDCMLPLCDFAPALSTSRKSLFRTYGIVRSDERVVDKFEEQTLRVVNAAKNPRLTTRLRTEYNKTLPLQEKAVQSIFGGYTHNHDLQRAYEYVLYCQAMFEHEYRSHVDNPRHGNRVTRLPKKSQAFRQVAN